MHVGNSFPGCFCLLDPACTCLPSWHYFERPLSCQPFFFNLWLWKKEPAFDPPKGRFCTVGARAATSAGGQATVRAHSLPGRPMNRQ